MVICICVEQTTFNASIFRHNYRDLCSSSSMVMAKKSPLQIMWQKAKEQAPEFKHRVLHVCL